MNICKHTKVNRVSKAKGHRK